MYKVYVATKGSPNLREVEFGSEDWIRAHSLLEDPLADPEDVTTMITNDHVLDEAYIFSTSLERAEEMAHSFIYDEPIDNDFDKVFDCFRKGDSEGQAGSVTILYVRRSQTVIGLTSIVIKIRAASICLSGGMAYTADSKSVS